MSAPTESSPAIEPSPIQGAAVAAGKQAKEAKETKHFLRMIAASEPQLADRGRALYREAKELHLIFATIFRK